MDVKIEDWLTTDYSLERVFGVDKIIVRREGNRITAWSY